MVVARIQLPDGRVGRFEVPEGTTPEQVQSFIQQPQEEFTTNVQPLPLGPESQILRPGEQLDMAIGSTSPGELFRQGVGQALQSRQTFQAAGGTLGAVLGSPGGPVGAAGGGVLGAAGGDALFNIIESAKAAFGEREVGQGLSIQGVKRAFEKPLEAATEEAGFTTALGVAGIPLRAAKPFIGKALKVTTNQAKELMSAAEKLDIPLGAINVTPSEAIKGFSRVLGVFPFVGTPLRESFASQTAAIDRSLDKILNSVAPTATLGEIGVDLTQAATSKFKAFRRLSGALYDDFLKKADAASVKDIFPTSNVKATAAEIKRLQDAGAIDLPEGGRFGQIGEDPMTEIVEQTLNLPKRLSAQQLRGVKESLQRLMTKASADGFDVSRGVQLKKGLELDFNNPQVDLLNFQEAQDITESLTRANQFFGDNIQRFQTATAKKFGRIEKNIFKPKFAQAGTRETDEAFTAVFNSKSPDALNNLRDVVGQKVFKQAARKHLDNSVGRAVTETVDEGGNAIRVFDPAKLEKNLGLDTVDGRKILEETLKGSGVTLQQLDDFNRVVQSVGSVEIPDVSQFLQRRLTLGGAAAITGLGGFATGGGSLLTKLGLIALTRSTARLLSSPQALRDMQAIIDPTVITQVKRAAVLRILRSLPESEEKEGLLASVNEISPTTKEGE